MRVPKPIKERVWGIPKAEKQDTEIQKKQLVWQCTQEAEVGTQVSHSGLSTSA